MAQQGYWSEARACAPSCSNSLIVSLYIAGSARAKLLEEGSSGETA